MSITLSEINVVLADGAIKITSVNDPNAVSSDYPVDNITEITGHCHPNINLVTNEPTNIVGDNYPFEDMLVVKIRIFDIENYLNFDIQHVQNQVGWTADKAGLQQAIDDIMAFVSATSGGGAAILTPLLTTDAAAGSVTAGARSVTIANTGANPGNVLGTPLPAGATVEWSAEKGETLTVIAYDPTVGGGTTYLISELR